MRGGTNVYSLPENLFVSTKQDILSCNYFSAEACVLWWQTQRTIDLYLGRIAISERTRFTWLTSLRTPIESTKKLSTLLTMITQRSGPSLPPLTTKKFLLVAHIQSKKGPIRLAFLTSPKSQMLPRTLIRSLWRRSWHLVNKFIRATFTLSCGRIAKRTRGCRQKKLLALISKGSLCGT